MSTGEYIQLGYLYIFGTTSFSTMFFTTSTPGRHPRSSPGINGSFRRIAASIRGSPTKDTAVPATMGILGTSGWSLTRTIAASVSSATWTRAPHRGRKRAPKLAPKRMSPAIFR